MTQDPEARIDHLGFDGAGFAERYHTHRPRPPEALLDLLCRLARRERPELVVDLGCGTGLSTVAWAGRAGSVLGVEESPAMLAEAEARRDADVAPNVRFARGDASDTGLLQGSVDIVTCAQSLHWLRPEPTFAEVARILRPGGVFAAYDYDWPPSVDWELEQAYFTFMEGVQALLASREGAGRRARPEKREHLRRIQDSGRFRFTREVLVHSIEEGSAERFVGLTLSQGTVERAHDLAVAGDELGIEALRAQAARALPQPRPWLFSYRVRYGVR